MPLQKEGRDTDTDIPVTCPLASCAALSKLHSLSKFFSSKIQINDDSTYLWREEQVEVCLPGTSRNVSPLLLQELEEQQQRQPRASRRKEITKIRAE